MLELEEEPDDELEEDELMTIQAIPPRSRSRSLRCRQEFRFHRRGKALIMRDRIARGERVEWRTDVVNLAKHGRWPCPIVLLVPSTQITLALASASVIRRAC